jgi:hypothetical protein
MIIKNLIRSTRPSLQRIIKKTHDKFFFLALQLEMISDWFLDWHLKILTSWQSVQNFLPTEWENLIARQSLKNKKNRSIELTDAQTETYHKNSLKSLRSAINRHLQDLGRSIDVVRDKEFKAANHTLDGMLKSKTKTGASRTTLHKDVINTKDLQRTSSYFKCAPSSPVVLQQCVWYNLSIHFISSGLEFHHQLRMDSFHFQKDGNDLEYATVRHKTLQKNFPGWNWMSWSPIWQKYLWNSWEWCMSNKNASSADEQNWSKCYTLLKLFNFCYKEALSTPALQPLWYTAKPLAKQTF